MQSIVDYLRAQRLLTAPPAEAMLATEFKGVTIDLLVRRCNSTGVADRAIILHEGVTLVLALLNLSHLG